MAFKKFDKKSPNYIYAILYIYKKNRLNKKA